LLARQPNWDSHPGSTTPTALLLLLLQTLSMLQG
jgi:hypothetical protein